MDALPKETLELAKKYRFKSLKILDLDLGLKIDDTPFGAHFGVLPNGLTYYVRCNPKPQMRAALALAVKVGYVMHHTIHLLLFFLYFESSIIVILL